MCWPYYGCFLLTSALLLGSYLKTSSPCCSRINIFMYSSESTAQQLFPHSLLLVEKLEFSKVYDSLAHFCRPTRWMVKSNCMTWMLIHYLDEPVACVEREKVCPVEEGCIIKLPLRKHLLHICGPPEGAVPHQEGHTIQTGGTTHKHTITHTHTHSPHTNTCEKKCTRNGINTSKIIRHI